MQLMTGTTLFHGGPIYTIDKTRPTAEAVLVRDGRIVAIGAQTAVEQQAGAGAQRVDLAGRSLLPGFIDAHAHPYGYGRIWGEPIVNIRASHIPTYEAVIATIKRRVAKAKPDEVLAFVGLDALSHAGMREPTLAELDSYAPNHPLGIYTFNFHALFVNSTMLKRLGITEAVKDIPGGRYERDAAGKLTGKLVEFAAFNGFHRICELLGGSERGYNELRSGLMRFAHGGITTTTDIGYHEGALPAYERLHARETLPIRIMIYARANFDGPDVPKVAWGGDDIKLIGIKVWADGSPFVGTVWLSKPFLNSEVTLKGLLLPRDYVGHMNYPAEKLREQIERYAKDGWQIATHVQGDRTIDATLDIYEDVLKKYGSSKAPYRLEHCGTMRDDQIKRALDLGVVCNFFVPHVYHWGDPIRDALLGPERAGNYMPAGSATRMGMRVAYHSDAPMTEPEPLLAIQTAVTRRSNSGAVIGPHQRVSIDEALRAMTIDAAYHIGLEDEIGSLEVGKRADFVILGSDPHTVAPETLASIKVCGTWLGGREVWSATA
jgi:predicted amidohydrolase YtcJ